jgi:hypothetical protein
MKLFDDLIVVIPLQHCKLLSGVLLRRIALSIVNDAGTEAVQVLVGDRYKRA